MKLHNILCMLILLSMAGNSWAYGSSSSSSKKACDKPKFTEFFPGNNAQISAKSAFSLRVSGADANSIVVTIKEQSVAVTVTEKNQGLEVTGMLPDNLKSTYARINVTAEGPNRCKGSEGWLVKIME